MANEFVARNGIIALDDSIITGSLTITGIVKSTTTPLVSGSSQISYTGITDKPDLISGSSQINITETTGYSSFSSSIATTDLNQTNRINLLETSTGSLNTFTSSANVRLTSLESASGSIRTDFNTYTSSNNTTNTTQNSRLTSLESASGSIRTDFNTYTSSNNTTNTTQNSRLTSIESVTGSISSLNTYTGSNNTVIGTLQTATSSLNTFTSSANVRLTSLESASGSIRTDFNTYTSSNNTTNTTQNSRLGALETATGSIITVNTTQNSRLTSLESASGSIRTDFNTYTGSNNTTNTTQNSRLTSLETTTGSLNSYTGSNNTVIGTLQTATSSLNTFSNSFNSAFSLSGEDVTVRGNFTVSGTTTTVNSTTVNIADNIIQLNGSGASNAGLVVRDATSPNTISGSLLWDTTNDRWIAGPLGSEQIIVLNNTFTGYTSTTNTRLTSIETSTGSLNTFTGSINTTIKNRLNAENVVSGSSQVIYSGLTGVPNGLVSGSSQIDHNTTTNYVANQHIDHTTVSISPGNGLSGGGTIAATRTLTLDTGSSHFTNGVKTKMNSDGVISGSGQVVLTSVNGYTAFSSSIATTNLTQDGRLTSLESTTGSLNTFTSSAVLTSQTGSMTVLSSSFATTASFALIAGGVNAPIGTYNTLVVTTPSTTWNFQHNTGQQYPIFQVFNENGYVIIPSQIRTIDNDNAEIIFSSPQSGRVVASLGGGNGTTKEFTNSNLWVVDHDLGTDYPDVTVWDSNRNIIFPNQIESVNSNQIKIYFSSLVSGHVSVSRGGHILSGGAVEVSWDEVNNKPSGIVSGSSQVLAGTTIHSGSFFNGITVVSGSSQISHNSTTGYVANQHIDHTTVSISPGSGLSGGGTIAATRTLTLDTGSVHFLDGVKKELNTDGVISGSLQITGLGYATTGSNAFKNNQIVTGSLTVTGNGEFGGQAFSIIHNQGTVSTTTNIDWDLSNVRTITLGASVITLTFSNPKPGATYTLIIKQDGTGNRTIGWPTIRWPGGTPPTLTSVLNSVDVVTLIYDGSVYYGAYINDLK